MPLRPCVAVAAATAPIQPLAWELPHAMSVALKRPRRKKKKKAESDLVSLKWNPEILYFQQTPSDADAAGP